MEMQDLNLAVSYVPYEYVPFFATSPDASDEVTPGTTEYRELQQYVAEKLLAGPPEGVRDRIGTLLRDERYHELGAKLGDKVPLRVLLRVLERGTEQPEGATEFLPAALRTRYIHAAKLQAHVLFSWVSYLEKNTGRKRTQRGSERLAFMQESIPAALKRALLAFWIAPMCRVAVTAGDGSVAHATRAALLDEWIFSMEQQLALYVALGVDAPPEDILPIASRMSLGEMFAKYFRGVSRTLDEMATLDRKAPSQDESPKPNY